VYLPLPDLYAQFGAGGLHIDVEAEGLIDASLLAGLRHGGYDFDLVHDHALADLATVEGGALHAGTARYPVVVVPGARFMPPESAERVAELVRAGGHVIFLEGLPEGAAGLQGREERSARVLRALEGLWGRPPAPGDVARAGSGTAMVATDGAAILARLGTVLPPDFRIVEPAADAGTRRDAAVENVGFVHRREGRRDWYFVANVSSYTQDLRVAFAVGHRSPELFDLEGGEVVAPLVYDYATIGGQRTTEVELRLEPFESGVVAFGTAQDPPLLTRTDWPGRLRVARVGDALEATGLARADGEHAFHLASGRVHRFTVEGVPPDRAIPGPWTLVLGEGTPLRLDALRSWTKLPEGRAFSGWATYETEFEGPGLSDDVEWVLDLGVVHETAEVFLNGQALGAAWKGLRRVPCGAALVPGRNRLRIEVANLWIHDKVARPAPDLRALEETFGIRWGRYGEVPPETLPPAGLLGPVRLLPFKRVVQRIP
jgi:hypothetical protein